MYELGESPVVATPHVSNYREIIEWTCDRIAQPLDAFRRHRFEKSYPPIPAFLVLAHPLGTRD